MSFEIQVVSNTPLIGEEDLDIAAKKFFEQIGYISKGTSPDVPYKIFADFFLKHPNKSWFVDEIATELKISRPTVYRHLNKLKGFDILEEIQVFDETNKQNKKAYKIVYHDIRPTEEKRYKKYPKSKNIAFLFEAPYYFPTNYYKNLHKYFSKIYTCMKFH